MKIQLCVAVPVLLAACTTTGPSDDTPSNNPPATASSSGSPGSSSTSSATDGGTGFTPPPGCEGTDITGDRALALDVRSVDINGRVTIQGAAAELGGQELLFTQKDSGSTALVTIDSDGSYRALLAPGRYSVKLKGASDCLGAIPCTDSTAFDDVELASSRVLDVDVPVVRAHLAVTFEGAAPANAGFAGYVGFIPTDGGTAGFVRIEDGLEWDAMLGPGTYAVSWLKRLDWCGARGRELRIPCAEGILIPLVSLAQDGRVDLDVPSARVQGVVRLNGVLGGPRADHIVMRRQDGRDTILPLSDDGTGARFDTFILPGTYDLLLPPVGSPCPAAFPCNGGTFQRGLVVTTDAELDLNIAAVRVQGTVTLAGNAVAPGEGGVLEFQREAFSAVQPLDTSDDGTYSLMLLAGTYSVTHTARSGCREGRMPCTTSLVATEEVFSADRTLDVDLQAAALTLHVRHEGTDITTSGRIRLDALDGSGTFNWPTDPGTYKVVPGRYRVRYDGGDCGESPALPCGEAILVDDVTLSADRVLDVDVPSADVQYSLTLNGSAYPSMNTGGYLLFRPLDGKTAGATRRLSSNAGTVKLVQGTSLVVWAPDLICSNMVARGLPCSVQVLAGCE